MLVALLSKERNVPKRMQSAAYRHGPGRGGMHWLQTKSQQSGTVWPSVPGIARLPLVPVDPNGSNLEFVRLLGPNDSCWLEGFHEVIYQTMMVPKCSRCGAWSMGKCSGKTWRKKLAVWRAQVPWHWLCLSHYSFAYHWWSISLSISLMITTLHPKHCSVIPLYGVQSGRWSSVLIISVFASFFGGNLVSYWEWAGSASNVTKFLTKFNSADKVQQWCAPFHHNENSVPTSCHQRGNWNKTNERVVNMFSTVEIDFFEESNIHLLWRNKFQQKHVEHFNINVFLQLVFKAFACTSDQEKNV